MKQKYPTKDATTLWCLTTLRISRARLLFMSMVLNSSFLTYNSKYRQVFHKQIRFHFCFQLHILKPIMSVFFSFFGGPGRGCPFSCSKTNFQLCLSQLSSLCNFYSFKNQIQSCIYLSQQLVILLVHELCRFFFFFTDCSILTFYHKIRTCGIIVK